MLVSTKGRYALSVMMELARKFDEGYIPLKDIANRQNLSLKYLEAIFKPLIKAGFVEGQRGRFGGFRLKKDPSEITVYSIIELAEHGLKIVAIDDSDNLRREEHDTLWIWNELDNLIVSYLKSLTLESIANKK